jgi:hypothetical protein
MGPASIVSYNDDPYVLIDREYSLAVNYVVMEFGTIGLSDKAQAYVLSFGLPWLIVRGAPYLLVMNIECIDTYRTKITGIHCFLYENIGHSHDIDFAFH